MVLYTPVKDLKEFFKFEDDLELRAGFNICPSQDILVVRAGAKGREGAVVRWGLIPAWAKDETIGNKLANARSETVHEKPSFRAALKKRRCLIPVNGFYEWRKAGAGKQPVFIHRKDGAPFAIAGLYEFWKGPDGPVQTATLLTTAPNALMEPIHDRMPVIVAPRDYELWLDPGVQDGEALRHLYAPCPPDAFEAYEVGKAVNNPRNQGPELIAAVPA